MHSWIPRIGDKAPPLHALEGYLLLRIYAESIGVNLCRYVCARRVHFAEDLCGVNSCLGDSAPVRWEGTFCCGFCVFIRFAYLFHETLFFFLAFLLYIFRCSFVFQFLFNFRFLSLFKLIYFSLFD